MKTYRALRPPVTSREQSHLYILRWGILPHTSFQLPYSGVHSHTADKIPAGSDSMLFAPARQIHLCYISFSIPLLLLNKGIAQFLYRFRYLT